MEAAITNAQADTTLSAQIGDTAWGMVISVD